jgi:hypothetical protein
MSPEKCQARNNSWATHRKSDEGEKERRKERKKNNS